MKNTKTKIILSAIIFLSVISFVDTVDAAGASLYVSPATLTKTAGDAFNVSVGVNASGNKVCAVEGALVFNNLSCQSITVADGVMAQSSPTCSNPRFLIGIQNCTILDRVLFTVSVKAGNAGTSSISFTAVDIIGEGASISTAFAGGNYTITVPVVAQEPVAQEPVAQLKESSVLKTKPEGIQKIPEVETPAQEATSENNISENIGTAAVAAAGSKFSDYLKIALFILIVVGVGYVVYYFLNKKKKNIDSTMNQ